MKLKRHRGNHKGPQAVSDAGSATAVPLSRKQQRNVLSQRTNRRLAAAVLFVALGLLIGVALLEHLFPTSPVRPHGYPGSLQRKRSEDNYIFWLVQDASEAALAGLGLSRTGITMVYVILVVICWGSAGLYMLSIRRLERNGTRNNEDGNQSGGK
jgi:hypothetical protein